MLPQATNFKDPNIINEEKWVNFTKADLIAETHDSQGNIPLLHAKVGNDSNQTLPTDCLVDTGANINLMHRSFFNMLKEKHDIKPIKVHGNYKTADNSICKLEDQVRVTFKLKSTCGNFIKLKATCFIVDALPYQILLGTAALSAKEIDSLTTTSITFKKGKDRLKVMFSSPSIYVKSVKSCIIQPNNFQQVSSFLEKNFNNDENYSFRPVEKLGNFEAYFKPQKGFNVFTIKNITNHLIKINKGEIIGTITPLQLYYDPNDSKDNLCYYMDNEDFNRVNFIHFKDRILNSTVLNEDEKSDLISDFDQNSISQIPMSDYIEQHDRSQCEFKDHQNERESDPIQKVKLDHLSPEIQEDIRKILRRNEACLARHSLHVGKVPENILTAKIPLKESEDKYKVQKFFPLPPAIKTGIQKIIDQYLDMGILEYSHQPAQMISNLLAVKKKDGSLRLLCDLRLLNSISQKLTAPFIQIPHIADLLQGKKFRSSFDLSNSFFQIAVDPSSRPLLCFRDTKNRILRYRRLPQGLTSSPYYLSELASKISEGIDNTLSFVDDFLFCHQSLSGHNDILDKLLRKLCRLNLTIRPEKLQILTDEIDFLGYTFKANKLAIPELKIKTFLELPIPQTARKCKSMVCAFSYFRTFIPDFTSATHHMRASFREPKKFNWTAECTKEFEEFKRILQAKIELQYVDFSNDFTCYVDASKYSVAFSIFQKDKENPEKEAPITFCSRVLNKYESTKSANELECIAIVWGLVATDIFLRFVTSKIVIKTDCRSLIFLKNVKSVSDHMYRLSEKLNMYQIHIEHIPGTANSLADFYSRLNIHRPTKREETNITYLSPEDSNYIVDRLLIKEGTIFTPEKLREMFKGAPPQLFTKGKTRPLGKKSKPVYTVPTNSMPSKKQNLPKYYSMKRQRRANCALDFNDSDFLFCNDKINEWRKDDRAIFSQYGAYSVLLGNQPVFRHVNSELFDSILNRVIQVFLPAVANAAIKEKPQNKSLSKTQLAEKQKSMNKELKQTIFSPDMTISEHGVVSSLNRNGCITKNDMLHAQTMDAYCKRISLGLDQNEDKYKLYTRDICGIIGKKTKRLKHYIWKPVLPEILLNTLVKHLHFGFLGLHCPRTKIVDMIDRHFLYPKLAKKVKSILSDCYHCFFNKAPPKQKLKLKTNIRATRPLQVVAIDYAGEYVPDNEENTKLLVFTDEFSGFIIAYPCKNKDEKTSERFISLFIQHFGTPEYIRSDDEKSFKSSKIQKIYTKYQITHLECSPYNPNSNSRVEIAVRKLKEAIRANLHTFPQQRWSETVMDICLALNSTPLACKATPSELLFGKSNLILYEENQVIPNSESEKIFMQKLKAYRDHHIDRRTSESDRVRESLNEKSDRVEPNFQVNDLVYVRVRSQGKNHALRPRVEGPYYIKEFRHQNSVQLESAILHDNIQPRLAHVKDLLHQKSKDETKTKNPAPKARANATLVVESAFTSVYDSLVCSMVDTIPRRRTSTRPRLERILEEHTFTPGRDAEYHPSPETSRITEAPKNAAKEGTSTLREI